jgi:hypothetical protein
MAAGQGFKTFTTGDVLTAADTNGYLMQGVWVFADAAARDAAVTSPEEGNMCYLKSTDATQFYSGSAWTAVGGSGGFSKIQTSTFTGVTSTTTTFDGVFTSTYKNYMLTMSNLSGTVAGQALGFQLRNAGSTIGTNGYYGSRLNNATVTSFSNAASIGVVILQVAGSTGSINMVVNRSQTPIQGSFYGADRNGLTSVTGAFLRDGTNADTADGFILSAASGNIAGTVTVYGLEN